MLKVVAGLVAGLFVALAAIYVIWLVALQVYPLPVEGGIRSLESEGALIESMPTGALIFVAIAWFGGAFIGALTAAHISRRLWPAWVVAFLVAAISISNIVMFPHPTWMQLAAVIVPILGGLIATHMARRSLGSAIDAHG